MSTMTINWFCDGKLAYVGEITRCVNYKDQINVLFKTEIEAEPVEGKLSIKITNEEQQTEGLWIYPDAIKENARVSEEQASSEETRYPAVVKGKLYNFKGKTVSFKGTWKDETEECEVEIDGEIA